MMSLYVFENKKPVLLGKYNVVDTEAAINEYLKSINKVATNFQHLGELAGQVYRVSFQLTIDGVTKEYYLVQS